MTQSDPEIHGGETEASSLRRDTENLEMQSSRTLRLQITWSFQPHHVKKKLIIFGTVCNDGMKGITYEIHHLIRYLDICEDVDAFNLLGLSTKVNERRAGVDWEGASDDLSVSFLKTQTSSKFLTLGPYKHLLKSKSVLGFLAPVSTCASTPSFIFRDIWTSMAAGGYGSI
jgi:hypothetical protein